MLKVWLEWALIGGSLGLISLVLWAVGTVGHAILCQGKRVPAWLFLAVGGSTWETKTQRVYTGLVPRKYAGTFCKVTSVLGALTSLFVFHYFLFRWPPAEFTALSIMKRVFVGETSFTLFLVLAYVPLVLLLERFVKGLEPPVPKI